MLLQRTVNFFLKSGINSCSQDMSEHLPDFKLFIFTPVVGARDIELNFLAFLDASFSKWLPLATEVSCLSFARVSVYGM